jgi:hypothetical protein
VEVARFATGWPFIEVTSATGDRNGRWQVGST